MDDRSIVTQLRRFGRGATAVDIAGILQEMFGGTLSQGALITYFKRAFPEIPLRVLLEAGAWNRVSDGGLSDAEFDELLRGWLPER